VLRSVEINGLQRFISESFREFMHGPEEPVKMVGPAGPAFAQTYGPAGQPSLSICVNLRFILQCQSTPGQAGLCSGLCSEATARQAEAPAAASRDAETSNVKWINE
jgi:hypothetical protein